MNQRNLLLFVAGSMALLGLNLWLTQKYGPKPVPAAAAQVQQQSASQTAPQQAPAPQPAAVQAAPAAVDPKAVHEVRSATFKLTFLQASGALKQVEWAEDGTRFFPEAFPGVGGALDTTFTKVTDEATPQGPAVHFENAQGEHLTYRIPERGTALSVEWSSPQGHALQAVPMLASDEEAERLDRVFTISEKSIDAVSWPKILHAPWYSFLGGKKKELPPAQSRVGVDAGLEGDSKTKFQQNHYFTAIWKMPRPVDRDARGFHAAPEQGHLTGQLYLGPKHVEKLAAFDVPSAQAVDFGFFGSVAKLLFWILRGIQKVVGNWGWTIVLFTILIRLALWHLNTKTTLSMLRAKDFEPYQKAIQKKYEKFGNDMSKKAEMQKEVMDLYKKNGHNPLGGCLPSLIQMPVFLALWSMLRAAFELRHAPFVGYLNDLSAKDPHYVLPVAMGLSMFAQQAVTPAMGDPDQRKIMMVMMPAMMAIFFAQSPAGLCLYYLVFNLIGLAQTWWVKRSYVPQPIKA